MTTPHLDPTRPDDDSDIWTTPQRLVQIHAPTERIAYCRLGWIGAERRRRTTAGKTFSGAWDRALDLEADLLLGATPKTQEPLTNGVAYWLDPARPTPRGGWGDSHRANMAAYARVYFLPAHSRLRCMDLRRSHVQQWVNAGPTASEGRNLRRAAASLVGALRQGDYLLDNQAIDLSNVFWHGVDARQHRLVESGEDTSFVASWSRPSTAQVEALRTAAEKTGRDARHRWWRGLMVELAAFAGPRWSELIALTHQDVHVDRRTVDVHWRVAQPSGKPRTLARPKMAKRRTTLYPEVSPTGYPLGDMVLRRQTEAATEHNLGWNRRGLLFPSPGGDWWYTGVFHRDLFEKAALAAGWPFTDEVRPYGGGTRQQRSWQLTWHSLRHTFCTTALEEWRLPESTVALVAGHSDPSFTRSRYVGAAEDALNVAIAATGSSSTLRAKK